MRPLHITLQARLLNTGEINHRKSALIRIQDPKKNLPQSTKHTTAAVLDPTTLVQKHEPDLITVEPAYLLQYFNQNSKHFILLKILTIELRHLKFITLHFPQLIERRTSAQMAFTCRPRTKQALMIFHLHNLITPKSKASL